MVYPYRSINVNNYEGAYKMAQIVNINTDELLKCIKIDVVLTGYKRFRVRLFIGSLFIKLGIWITGVNGNVKFED